MKGPADTLGLRIATGFILLALSVIAVFATVTLLLIDYDLNAAAHRQLNSNIAAITLALQKAYNEDHSWTSADLAPTVALAQAYGVSLDMRALSNTILTVTARAAEGPTAAFDVVSGGNVVAHVKLRQPTSGLSPAQAGLRHTITKSVMVTTLVAVLLALAGAALLARRLSRPLHKLEAAVRRFGQGDKPAPLQTARGPREVRDLMTAFDTMAADLQLEERLRRELTANVAHELRTPLSILQAQTTALADRIIEWSPDLARSFEEEVARLSRLVEDLGILAAAQSASLTIERVPVRLDHLVRDAVERLQHRFHQRRISLQLDLSPATILGDADRVEQIIANLLGNAARYVQPAGVVRVIVADDKKPKLVVSDNGPGIPESERAQIFERFARGSTAAGVAGSGIGLAVVQELVSAHGGTVELQASPEGGSEFTVTFPLPSIGRNSFQRADPGLVVPRHPGG
jgi:two-component system sensor histidine kinase BaeS